ncbi:MAG: hypothetical protein FWE38_00495 [Firmicutes bacterium]|nr:hypothetical protein [Bacillota bacterium]
MRTVINGAGMPNLNNWDGLLRQCEKWHSYGLSMVGENEAEAEEAFSTCLDLRTELAEKIQTVFENTAANGMLNESDEGGYDLWVKLFAAAPRVNKRYNITLNARSTDEGPEFNLRNIKNGKFRQQVRNTANSCKELGLDDGSATTMKEMDLDEIRKAIRARELAALRNAPSYAMADL